MNANRWNDPPDTETTSEKRLEVWVLDTLERTQQWEKWAEADKRIAAFDTFDDAREAWRVASDFRTFDLVAALISLGCGRGGDDELAVLAALVMLAPGIARIAGKLSDVFEPDEVRSAVWEAIKAAEPHAGKAAARYVLRRAHQKLLARSKPRPECEVLATSLTSPEFEVGSEEAILESAADVTDPGSVDEAERELADVLAWSRANGVVGVDDLRFLLALNEASADGCSMGRAQERLGRTCGVTPRSIRRRRSAIVARLRAAAPRYLAATA